MIRSRFQHLFVIQSVLHSYLAGFVLFYVALQLQSSSTMLLQYLSTKSEVCTQSVLHSYLAGFVLFYVALQLQSSSTMLLQYLSTKSEVCTHTGYELYELLFLEKLVMTVQYPHDYKTDLLICQHLGYSMSK